MAAHHDSPADTKSRSGLGGLRNSRRTPEMSGEDKKHHIVTCLPHGTSEYEFKGIENAKKIYFEELERGNQFVIFSHVTPYIQRQILLRTSSYYPELQLLVVKTLGELHESAIGNLDWLLAGKLILMGLHKDISPTGSKEIEGSDRKREADRSYRPDDLPAGRSTKWPTLVIEAGNSESREQLARDAKWWLEESGAEVRTVITVDVEKNKREIIVQRWDAETSHITRNIPAGVKVEMVHSVTISRPDEQTTATVANAPFVVPFPRLFLRQPQNQREVDIAFTATDLAGWAGKVWSP